MSLGREISSASGSSFRYFPGYAIRQNARRFPPLLDTLQSQPGSIILPLFILLFQVRDRIFRVKAVCKAVINVVG
jgi:hypothetical protein